MKMLLVALLLLYPLSASAETYEWTDQKGSVNFTDDLGKVPKKYRKKVKVLGGEESGAPQVIEAPDTGKGKQKDAVAPAPATKKPAISKEEAAWRNDYMIAKANVQVTEDSVGDLRKRLSDTSKMSRAEYVGLQGTLKQEEFRLQEQKKKLDALKSTGDKLGYSLEDK